MEVWKKCSVCKSDIAVKSPYYVCSVSTCNSKRTAYVFCSIPCFERHLPMAKHRDAAAIEEIAPAHPAPEVSVAASTAPPKRRIIAGTTAPKTTAPPKGAGNQNEILVVVSKLKAYIKDCADMNTSQDVMSALSDRLRRECDRAIENARADGRKTVMARDF